MRFAKAGFKKNKILISTAIKSLLGCLLALTLLAPFFSFAPEAQAAVTFRSQTVVKGTGGNVTVAEPSGAAENDIFIAFVTGSPSATYGLPSGWTQLYSINHGNFKSLVGYVRRGTSAPNMTFSVSASVYREIIVSAYAGVVTSGNPIDSQSATGGSGDSSPGYPNPPSTNVSGTNVMVVTGGVRWNGHNGAVAPSGYTLRFSGESAMADRFLAASGVQDPGAFSGGASGSSPYWHGFTISLKSAPGATAVWECEGVTDDAQPATTFDWVNFPSHPDLIATPAQWWRVEQNVNGGAYTEIEDFINVGTTSHTVTSLLENTTYGYKVFPDNRTDPFDSAFVVTGDCEAQIGVSADVAGGSWTISPGSHSYSGGGSASNHTLHPDNEGTVYTISVTPPPGHYTAGVSHSQGGGSSITMYPQDSESFSIDFEFGDPPPTADLTADPNPINQGSDTTLTWTSVNADSCSATWTSSTDPDGSEVLSPASSTMYEIECTGAGGSIQDDVFVVVNLPVVVSVTSNSTTTYNLTEAGDQVITANTTNDHTVFPTAAGKLYTLTPDSIVGQDFQITYSLNSVGDSCTLNSPCSVFIDETDELEFTLTYLVTLAAPIFDSVTSTACGQVDIDFYDNSSTEDEFVLYRDTDNNYANGATQVNPVIPSTTTGSTGTLYQHTDADSSLSLGGDFFYHAFARRTSDGATSVPHSTSAQVNVAQCPPELIGSVNIINVRRNGIVIPYVAGATRILNGDVLEMEIGILNIYQSPATNLTTSSTFTDNIQLLNDDDEVVPFGGDDQAVQFVTSGGSQYIDYIYDNSGSITLVVPDSGTLPGTLTNEQWFLRYNILVNSNKSGIFDRINISGVINFEHDGTPQPAVTYTLNFPIIYLSIPGPVKYQEGAPEGILPI